MAYLLESAQLALRIARQERQDRIAEQTAIGEPPRRRQRTDGVQPWEIPESMAESHRTWQEDRPSRVAYRWKRFMWWTLAQYVDRILTEAYCCLTAGLRQPSKAMLLPPRQLRRLQLQKDRIGERLKIDKKFTRDSPPPYRLHLTSLATLRRPQSFPPSCD